MASPAKALGCFKQCASSTSRASSPSGCPTHTRRQRSGSRYRTGDTRKKIGRGELFQQRYTSRRTAVIEPLPKVAAQPAVAIEPRSRRINKNETLLKTKTLL